ncbi:hypothetical protein DUI87_11085 [Hirundo rustica rustica]|uniref:Uncharacterized protein n=1 Tax=Hirundo rustica rustica TaxID=333673 RepID=A0A3M0KFY1_HIRRU|nr:hypothetical protein DUI87_11085 [Hirundo rustica rustica]
MFCSTEELLLRFCYQFQPPGKVRTRLAVPLIHIITHKELQEMREESATDKIQESTYGKSKTTKCRAGFSPKDRGTDQESHTSLYFEQELCCASFV